MGEAFDYVIVGGGSAGAVLAHRLSADPAMCVALLEAGPDTPPEKVPDIILDSYPGRAYFDPRFHWQDLRVYNRSPEIDPAQKPSRFEQARVMGGGSSINGQFAVRGMQGDYDEWEEMGLPGWSTRACCPTSTGWSGTSISPATATAAPGAFRCAGSSRRNGAGSAARRSPRWRTTACPSAAT